MIITAYLELLTGGEVHRERTAHFRQSARNPSAAAVARRDAARAVAGQVRGSGDNPILAVLPPPSPSSAKAKTAKAAKTAKTNTGTGLKVVVGRFDTELLDLDYHSDLLRTGVGSAFHALKKDSFDKDGGTLYLAFDVEGSGDEIILLSRKLASPVTGGGLL